MQGVPVRWTITDDDPDARFANATGDGNEITVSTDASGLSSVSLEQVTEDIGENSVLIEVLTQDGRTMFSHTPWSSSGGPRSSRSARPGLRPLAC